MLRMDLRACTWAGPRSTTKDCGDSNSVSELMRNKSNITSSISSSGPSSPISIALTNDSRGKPPDELGENIINSELEILTSLDLAQEVVTKQDIGPEKILAKAGGGADPQRAAALIRKGLIVDVPKRSSVIRLVF